MNFKQFWSRFSKERHPARLRDNLLFWFCSLLYMEILFHVKLYTTFDGDLLYILAFTLIGSLTVSGLLGLLPEKANRIVSCILICVLSLLFCGQMIYHSVFGTVCSVPPDTQAQPLSHVSLGILDVVPTVLVLLPIPASILLAKKQRRIFRLNRNIYRVLMPAIALVLLFLINQSLMAGNSDPHSVNGLYRNPANSPTRAAQHFGLLPTMSMDLFSKPEPEPEPPAPTEPTVPATEDYTEPEETKIPLKIQVFGDSMSDNTWGDKQTWVNLLHNYLPEYDLSIVNSAIGGNTLMEMTDTDGAKKGLTKGIAYHLATGATPIWEDADLIIVWAGSNDWASAPDLGTLRNGDPSTFYGGVQYVVETLLQTDAQLLFITPVQRNTESDQLYKDNLDIYGNRINNKCATLEQYAQAIMQTCAYYDVPCLDLYHTSGITQDNIHFYADDGLHLNAEAEPMIAERIAYAILNPSICTPHELIPAYDLSVLTDTYHQRPCESIPVDGSRIFLNWNFDGIKTAFSNGYVTLRYPVNIHGTERIVSSTGTAAYSREDDCWTFVSYFEHEGILIRVRIVFMSYALEASAVSIG